MKYFADPAFLGAVGTALSALLATLCWFLKRLLDDVQKIKINFAVMATRVNESLQVKKEHDNTRERVIVLEGKAKAAHRRLDEFQQSKGH